MNKIIVIYDEDNNKKEITFHYIKDDFNCNNLDAMIRSYNGLSNAEKLIYTNKNNDLIIPSSSMKVPIYCKRLKNEMNENKNKVMTIEDSFLKFLINYGSLILIILTAISLTKENNYISNIINYIINTIGIIEHKKILTEAWISFICWSTSNLFVRRLLNPETTRTAYIKYTAGN